MTYFSAERNLRQIKPGSFLPDSKNVAQLSAPVGDNAQLPQLPTRIRLAFSE